MAEDYSRVVYRQVRNRHYRGRPLDEWVAELSNELVECYFEHWRHGQSKKFRGKWDVQATPEESEALYSRLYNLIHLSHSLVVSAELERLGIEDRPDTALAEETEQLLREKIAENPSDYSLIAGWFSSTVGLAPSIRGK